MCRDGGQYGLWDTPYLSNVVVSSKTKGMLNQLIKLWFLASSVSTTKRCFDQTQQTSPVNMTNQNFKQMLAASTMRGKKSLLIFSTQISTQSFLFLRKQSERITNGQEIATRREKCHVEKVACFKGSGSEVSLLFASSSLSERMKQAVTSGNFLACRFTLLALLWVRKIDLFTVVFNFCKGQVMENSSTSLTRAP